MIEPLENQMGRFRCDCGKTITTRIRSVESGISKSCGCYHRDAVGAINRTHGLSKHPLYRTWKNMRNRCKNPCASKYELYGGRGIAVCGEWDSSFISFYDWAMNSGWKAGLSIDRIDPDGNYSPGNCRWVDSIAQNNNLRSNHNITYQGETRSVSAWARTLGLNQKTLSERLRRGWSVERAFTEGVIH